MNILLKFTILMFFGSSTLMIFGAYFVIIGDMLDGFVYIVIGAVSSIASTHIYKNNYWKYYGDKKKHEI